MRILILGCGYVGFKLGSQLVRLGHAVYGVRRRVESGEDLSSTGIQPCMADVTSLDSLRGLPGPFDGVVNTVSSNRGGAETFRSIYLEGTRTILEWLASQPPMKYVYSGSTSVYGQADGSLVDEQSPMEPETLTGRILVDTERLLHAAALNRGFPAIILRVAGIYGPGRGYLFRQFLKGEARIYGAGDRLINMIHVDDLVEMLIAVMERGTPGSIYNAVDDLPVTQLEFFRWLAETLDRPLPPSANQAEEVNRKRGLTSKRVSNALLKTELGYCLKYPTFRHGYRAEIDRLGL